MKHILMRPLSVLCALLLSIVLTASAGGFMEQSYLYPVRPGMDIWKTFRSHEQMAAACRVPEDVQRHLSTPALLDTVLEHPMIIDIYAQNSCTAVQRHVRLCQNAIPELEARPDAASLMLERYRELTGSENTPTYQEKLQADFLLCLLVEKPFYSALRSEERTSLGGLVRERERPWIHGVQEELEKREAEGAE